MAEFSSEDGSFIALNEENVRESSGQSRLMGNVNIRTNHQDENLQEIQRFILRKVDEGYQKMQKQLQQNTEVNNES